MTFTPLRLEYSSTTAEQVDYQHYSRDHQQQVNQRATDMADQAQQPQNQQDHKNCPEHSALLAGEYADEGPSMWRKSKV